MPRCSYSFGRSEAGELSDADRATTRAESEILIGRLVGAVRMAPHHSCNAGQQTAGPSGHVQIATVPSIAQLARRASAALVTISTMRRPCRIRASGRALGVVVGLGFMLGFAACTRAPHDRSYQYGVELMNSVVENEPGSDDERADCRSALRAHPAHFAGYDADHALSGCVDEWAILNR